MTPCKAIVSSGLMSSFEGYFCKKSSVVSGRSVSLTPQPPLHTIDKLVASLFSSSTPHCLRSFDHRVVKFFSFRTSVKMASVTKIDGDKIAEAFMSELAITRADDPRPIVTTYGCGPCVAVGGYDPTNKIAFVVHFTNEREVSKYGDLIFCNIVRLTKKPIRSPIQIHLRGGFKGISESTIKAIKVWVKQNDLPMEIVSEDVLGGGVEAKSLSIDSRTGEVSEYDVKANDKARSFSELDAELAMMSAYDPKITLAYAPK